MRAALCPRDINLAIAFKANAGNSVTSASQATSFFNRFSVSAPARFICILALIIAWSIPLPLAAMDIDTLTFFGADYVTPPASTNTKTVLSYSELTARGRALRRELLVDANARPAKQRVTISPSALSRHLTPGLSMRDAEIILRHAGLKTQISEMQPGALALTGSTMLSNAVFFRTDVVIDVMPTKSNDFHSGIGRVAGFIFHTGV